MTRATNHPAQPILIRTAEPADMPVLQQVFRRSSLSNVGNRGDLLANPDALELSDAAVLERRTRVATVANGRATGFVVGFATTVMSGDVLELEDLFVDPDWMGRGVGRELVLDVLSVAQQRGVKRVEVTANHHALAFYERVGFVVHGEIETRFGSAPRMHIDVARSAGG